MAGLITSKVRMERLTRIVREFPLGVRTELDPWIDKQIRSLISSSGKVPGLVQVTPPHMQGVRGMDAKRVGEAAVKRDIWEVYATPGKVYSMLLKAAGAKVANYWWALYKQAPREAVGWLEKSAPADIRRMSIGFDGGAAHEKARGRNGRVNLSRPSVMVISDTAAVGRYIRKRMKKVGLLAASVPSAAGGRFGKLGGLPAWVSRHTSRYGYVRDKRSRARRVVTLGMTNKAIQDMQRRFNYVLRYREAAMQRELPFVARALEKKLRSRLK